MKQEMVPIDGGAIVADPRYRAVAVIDESAIDSRDGWIYPEMPVSAEACPKPRLAKEPYLVDEPRGAIVWRLDIVLGGKRMRLHSRIPAQNIGVLPRIAHLAQPVAENDIRPPDHVLDLVQDEETYQLWNDGKLIFAAGTANQLVGELYVLLLELAHAPRRLMLMAHAAALVVDGASLILSAASGGGKTILSIGLAHAGAILLTDDTVGVDYEDLSLVGLPAALRVRAAGWPLAASRLAPEAGTVEPNRGGIRHIPPAWAGRTIERAPPAQAVILLDFVPDAQCSTDSLKAARGLAAMIQGGASLPETLDPVLAAPVIAGWCGQTRFYRLRYGNLTDGIAGIHAIRAELA